MQGCHTDPPSQPDFGSFNPKDINNRASERILGRTNYRNSDIFDNSFRGSFNTTTTDIR
jgi:hypothetical protein